MTISVVAASNTVDSDLTGADSTVVSIPSSRLAGDLLVLAYCVDDTLVSTPSGWTVAISESNGTTNAVVLWKISNGAETSVTLDWSGTDADGVGVVVVLRSTAAFPTAAPIRQSSKAEVFTTDTLAFTSLSGIAPDSMVLAVLAAHDGSGANMDTFTGYTQIEENNNTLDTPARYATFYYKNSPSSTEAPTAVTRNTLDWITGFLLEVAEGARGSTLFFGTNH